MKTTGFIATVAFLGLQAFALADTTTPTNTSATTTQSSECDPSQCPGPTTTATGGIQSCGQEWLNIDTLTIEAANGDPIAQYTLAYLTDTGTQVPQDTEKAKAMYAAARPNLEKAAAKGHPAACKALAHMCMNGTGGCAKDPKKAKKYLDQCKDKCTKPESTTPSTH